MKKEMRKKTKENIKITLEIHRKKDKVYIIYGTELNKGYKLSELLLSPEKNQNLHLFFKGVIESVFSKKRG